MQSKNGVFSYSVAALKIRSNYIVRQMLYIRSRADFNGQKYKARMILQHYLGVTLNRFANKVRWTLDTAGAMRL